jgi:chromosome segregation ATPase
MFEKVEAFLLEDKMLKLTEQRTKQELEQLNQELLELRKEDLEVNEQLREQRTDMESKRELYTAQSRCLKDEISTIRCEIRDRKDKVEKLKIRYDTSVKALGDIDQKKSSMPSHALHMVKVAQEKAELSEQSEVLAVKIEKEEEELESLEKAMALMKHSNDRYRVSNCRNADVNTDQTLELEEAMKQKVALVKQLKRRLVEVGNDIKQVEYLVEKCSGEVDRMKSLYDSRYSEAMQLDKELKDQERKLGRARHAVNTLCHDMKDLMPNPESFEHDMDLREEKEKQRSALLQIRELSNTDTTFNYRVQEDLGRLGLCIPPISRMEARATSSRTSRLTASTRIATAGSSRSGFYRQDGGHVSDSVVVMELDVGGGSSDQGRSKTAMTVG